MPLNVAEQEIKAVIEHLIDSGCNYRLDDLEELYDPKLVIVMLQSDGSVLNFDYQQNLNFFRQLKETGAPPLDKAAEYNYMNVCDQSGYVIVTRQMDLGAGPQKIVFNLMLDKSSGSWKVYREHAVVMN